MTTIRLHKGQSSVLRWLFPGTRAVRYAVAVASRGFGKSFLAAAAASMAIQELLNMPADMPNKNVSIIAPTYEQVTDIYWPLLAHTFGLKAQAIKSSRAEGYFEFPNGVMLNLWSYEASERMRGSGQYMTILDEVTTWAGKPGLKESWESIIQPTMTTRWPGNHKALIISTPKGFDYFYDLYLNESAMPSRWKSFHYTYLNSPYLSDTEIALVKELTDPLKFAREYLASFEESGNNVFYCFDRKKHLDPSLPDFAKAMVNGKSANEDVHVSIDFNVGIMAATMWAIRGNQMHALAEMQGHPDTDTLARTLKRTYAGHRIIAYPDPSGRSRKTSAAVGVTDFNILEQHGIITRAHSAHPSLVDSVAAVNRKLKNANGVIDMYFKTGSVPLTIRSMERTSWVETNPNVATINKADGVEHFSDGVRYITEFLYPVRNNNKVTSKGHNF